MVFRLLLSCLRAALLLVLMTATARAQGTDALLPQFLAKADPAHLVEGADGFGPIRDEIAVAPILKGGKPVDMSS